MTNQSSLSHFKKVIPAGGQVIKVSVSGKTVHIGEQVGTALPFEMRFDSLPWFPANQGYTFTLPSGDRFKEVHFRNPTTKSITVEFYAGEIIVGDARLSIVRGRLTAVMNAPSVWTAHSDTIAAGGEIDMTAVHPVFPKYLRKASIVTNMDPAVDLEILNADNETLDTVFFRSTKLYEVAEGIKVKNNTASPVVCRASQAWYVVEVE